MKYSMEKDFSVLLTDLKEEDARTNLLMWVYNAGAKHRMDAHGCLEDCKKYYPDNYSLLDIFDDLMDKVPPKALPDVQYAYSSFINERVSSYVTECVREKHAGKEEKEKEDADLELA